jgi:hypothetical protein
MKIYDLTISNKRGNVPDSSGEYPGMALQEGFFSTWFEGNNGLRHEISVSRWQPFQDPWKD